MNANAPHLDLKQLIIDNPNGLLRVAKSLTYSDYNNRSGGFYLHSGYKIFESKRFRSNEQDWYAFPESSENSLAKLFTVEQEPKKPTAELVVFVAEIGSNGMIHCNLILTNEAWQKIVADKNQEVLKVEQFYLRVLIRQVESH